MNKIRVGVLGASGYAGRELCRLVLGHPRLELAFATANEQRGATVRLGGQTVRYIAPDDAPLGRVALVFAALPHGASLPWVVRARQAGARVVDLSADLRPGQEHDAVALGSAAGAVPYGLTEVTRAEVRDAAVVANPGCYATAMLLALAPLVQQGLMAPGATVSVAAASGVTGAGNAPKRELLFGEVAEDFRAYATGNVHRHLREVRAMLAALVPVGAAAAAGAALPAAQTHTSEDPHALPLDLIFTPHLLPVARGILATITVPLAEPLADALAPWRDAFAGEPFIEVADEAPTLRDVVHRNVLRVHAVQAAGTRAPVLLVHAALDNLLKGAAGQALQNANLMLGLDEAAGLPA